MSASAPRTLAIAVTGLIAIAGWPVPASIAVPAPAVKSLPAASARPAATWSRLAPTFASFDQAGMLRLASGQLHVIWRERQGNGMFSYRTAAISRTGRAGATHTALSGWVNLEGDPRLIPGGPAVRLVFIGFRTNNAGDFYSRGAVYTEVSNGSSWTLVQASMAQHVVLNLGLAAVAKLDETPVAAFGLNNILYFHDGLDASAPAAGADGSVAGPGGVGLLDPALTRANDGSIWMAWYQKFGSHPGYYVQRILPTAGTPQKAPGSGTSTTADNEPFQQAAFVARPHGGLFLAYCSPTATRQCAHISLWRVGSSRTMTVPGSGSAGRVALSVAPGGRLWLAWLDFANNTIRTVQTNSAASRFGSVRTISQPRQTVILNGLQAEGSAGRLDLVVNILVTKPTSHDELWHVQIP